MGKKKGGFFLQAKDGIRDLVRSRGLGVVYKRQAYCGAADRAAGLGYGKLATRLICEIKTCLV